MIVFDIGKDWLHIGHYNKNCVNIENRSSFLFRLFHLQLCGRDIILVQYE